MESGRSKGQRLFLFGFIALIVAAITVPLAAAAGASIASSYNGTVLQGESGVSTIEQPSGAAIAYSYTSGSLAWTMPSGVTTAYLVTNITVNDAQSQSVNQFTFTSGVTSAGSVTFGLGTGAGDFLPYVQVSASSLASVNLPISPSFLTGSPSQHVILEVQSAAVSYTTTAFTARGNTGLSNWFGPAAAEDMGYIIGGIIVWILAILAMPWYDLEAHNITKPITRRLRGIGKSGRRKAAAKGGAR